MMPTYTAHSHGGDPIVVMEAPAPDKKPTRVTPVEGTYAGMAKYAENLIERFGDKATVQAITSKLGPYAYLTEGEES